MKVKLLSEKCRIKAEKGEKEELMLALKGLTDQFWISIDRNDKIEALIRSKGDESLEVFSQQFKEVLEGNG